MGGAAVTQIFDDFGAERFQESATSNSVDPT
jgi:hypothetical protein